ncbi:hypothetical protein Lfu02_41970 [Longispora fulva]|uniref:Uncharacterized protein n=1 Tax=Longispora fulva TaxID=619741 RepID=A0A8J7KKG0_9ACTN|nr:hypothetical protein [Longispora fulva]MBG6136656.1 hypothetical protein [Longispora fulva]GIG59825.1 hypothetical protein Lfu02_41970 [Longispora fulva]
MNRLGRVVLGLLWLALFAIVGVFVFVQFILPGRFEDRDRELSEHVRANAQEAATALAGQPDATEPAAVRLVGDHGGDVRSYELRPTVLVVVAEFSAKGSGLGGSVMEHDCFRLEADRPAATPVAPRAIRLDRCPPLTPSS